MKAINELRLLAGLPIDIKHEITEKKQPLNEGRSVPKSAGELARKSKKNMNARKKNIKTALTHARQSLDFLDNIPETDYMGDIPRLISDLEDIIDGLSKLGKAFDEEYRTWERQRNSSRQRKVMAKRAEEEEVINTDMISPEEEDMFARAEEEEMAAFEGVEDQLKKVLAEHNIELKDPRLITSTKYQFQQVYSSADYPNQPVHVQGDLYRLGETQTFVIYSKDAKKHPISEGQGTTHLMLNAMGIEPIVAEKEEEEKEEVQEVTNEAMHYNTDKNYPESHEDADDPVNVADDENLYYKKDNKADESPNQIQGNPYNEAQKVTVPASIKSSLRSQISEARSEAKTFERRRDFDSRNFHDNLANAFEEILTKLDKGTVYGLKEAQIFMTSLMGPMLHKLPADVVKFITNGGVSRSLKGYMFDVSSQYPVTGKAFKNPGEEGNES